MTDAPAWRYVDHLTLNFPPADIVDMPPQVLEAVEHEQVRSAGLSRALDQLDVALIELEAARAADANAELDAASSDARPAKAQPWKSSISPSARSKRTAARSRSRAECC